MGTTSRKLSLVEAREFLWSRVPSTARIEGWDFGAGLLIGVIPRGWQSPAARFATRDGFEQADLVDLAWKIRNGTQRVYALGPLVAAAYWGAVP